MERPVILGNTRGHWHNEGLKKRRMLCLWGRRMSLCILPGPWTPLGPAAEDTGKQNGKPVLVLSSSDTMEGDAQSPIPICFSPWAIAFRFLPDFKTRKPALNSIPRKGIAQQHHVLGKPMCTSEFLALHLLCIHGGHSSTAVVSACSSILMCSGSTSGRNTKGLPRNMLWEQLGWAEFHEHS